MRHRNRSVWECLSLPLLSQLRIMSINFRGSIYFPPVPGDLSACRLRKLSIGVDSLDIAGPLALLRLCPALEKLHLYRSFGDAPVTAAARMIIAAFELPKLERLSVHAPKVLVQHLERKRFKDLRPKLKLDLLSSDRSWHPDDQVQALALIDQYCASKIVPAPATHSQRLASSAS
jgi:hypothetical protein